MIISNGYSLSYHPNENQIIINIPQTASTATNTVLPIEERKNVEEADLTLLLTVTQIIFKNFEIVRRGNWEDEYECSVCHDISKDGKKYCGNCRANMREE